MVIVEKSGGTWWKCLLSFFGGILFTILLVVGGAAAAGALFTTGQLLGDNADTFLRAEYQNKTILDIVLDAVGGKIAFKTYEDISNITPLVDTVLDNVNTMLKDNLGVDRDVLNYEDIKSFDVTDVNGLGNYLFSQMKSNITLKDFIADDSDLVKYLTYNTRTGSGTEADPYVYSDPVTIGQIMEDTSFFEEKINNLKLRDVLGNSIENKALDAIKDKTINELKDADAFNDIVLGDIIGDTDNAVLNTIKDKTLGELRSADAFDDIKIGDLLGDTDNPTMNALKDKTIADLKDEHGFDDVKIGDLLGDSDNPTMVALKDKTLADLKEEDGLDDIKIGDLLGDSDNPTMDAIKDKTIADLKAEDGFDDITLGALLGSSDNPTYNAIKDKTIADIKQDSGLDDIKIGDLIGTDANPTMEALKDKTLGDLKTANGLDDIEITALIGSDDNPVVAALAGKTLGNLKSPTGLDDVLITELVGTNDNPVVAALTGKTLADLKTADGLDDVLISDLVGTNDNPVVAALAGKSLGDLKDEHGLDDVKIADVLNVDVTDPDTPKILKTFANNGTTIGGMSDAVNDLYLSDVLDYDDFSDLSPVMQKLVGKDDPAGWVEVPYPYTYTVKWSQYDNMKIAAVTDEDNYVGTDYLDVEDFYTKENIHLSYTGGDDYWTATSTGSAAVNPVCEDFIVTIDKPMEWDKVYVKMMNKPYKVNELGDATDSFRLKDVMNIDPGSPLYKVKNEKINDGDALFDTMKNSFTVDDIFPDTSGNKFLSNIPGDTKISEITDAINDIRILDAFEDDIYDNMGNMNATWKYLLVEEGELTSNLSGNTKVSDPFNRAKYVDDPSNSGTIVDGKYVFKCNDYTLGGSMSKMIENMQWHMENDSLRNLHNDGIIEFSDTTFMNNEIPALVKTAHPEIASKTYYGDLSVKEFVNIMASYAV